MFLEWEASSYVTNPKKLRSKKFIFSTHRDLKRSEAEGTPCTTPHGLGRSSAKHLGIKLQQKKRSHSNRKSLRWGLFISGIVVPNEEYPKGLSYRKWIVTRKNGWLVDMIGPSWGTLPFGVKWLKTWCSICHRTEKHPGHVLWPGPNHHFNPTVDNHISLVQSRDKPEKIIATF